MDIDDVIIAWIKGLPGYSGFFTPNECYWMPGKTEFSVNTSRGLCTVTGKGTTIYVSMPFTQIRDEYGAHAAYKEIDVHDPESKNQLQALLR